MEERKPVGILLRVSTAMQAKMANDEADIPTQRKACIDFIEKHPNWILKKEYMEVGVSGYKNSIEQRDKLLEVKDDIAVGCIAVLVVFMFDRLGRRDEETPFIVKNFVDMGCEVWSVQEGQRRFEAHVDSLLNYITFWQASGESKKTSERVTNAMNQMAEAGLYTGGRTPYGYDAVETGRITKKRLPEKTLEINEAEAHNVRLMFHLALSKDYGVHRIAKYLNEQGIPTRNGKQWGHATIAGIFRNPIYKGYKCYNRTTTKGVSVQRRLPAECWIVGPHNPQWEIVSERDWDRLHRLHENKAQMQKQLQTLNIQTSDYDTVKSKLLFAGLLYCDSCGSKMYTGYSPYKWKTKDGVIHRRRNPVYICSKKSTGKQGCTGQASFKPEVFEPIILESIHVYLHRLKAVDLEKGLATLREQNTSYEVKQIHETKKSITRLQNEIKALEDRIVRAIMGESSRNEQLLAKLHAERQEELAKQKEAHDRLLNAYENNRQKMEELDAAQNRIPDWRETYDKADMETQKAMLRLLIKRVHIGRNHLNVQYRIEIGEFIQGIGNESEPQVGGGKGDRL